MKDDPFQQNKTKYEMVFGTERLAKRTICQYQEVLMKSWGSTDEVLVKLRFPLGSGSGVFIPKPDLSFEMFIQMNDLYNLITKKTNERINLMDRNSGAVN